MIVGARRAVWSPAGGVQLPESADHRSRRSSVLDMVPTEPQGWDVGKSGSRRKTNA